jgi:hypothetical protein
MKTQGEVEVAICDGISRFEQEYMGGTQRHPGTPAQRCHLGPSSRRDDGRRKESGQVAPGRERERPAQASSNPLNRNSAADAGSAGPGDCRHQGLEPTPRHQHHHRRRSHRVHSVGAGDRTRDEGPVGYRFGNPAEHDGAGALDRPLQRSEARPAVVWISGVSAMVVYPKRSG